MTSFDIKRLLTALFDVFIMTIFRLLPINQGQGLLQHCPLLMLLALEVFVICFSASVNWFSVQKQDERDHVY